MSNPQTRNPPPDGNPELKNYSPAGADLQSFSSADLRLQFVLEFNLDPVLCKSA